MSAQNPKPIGVLGALLGLIGFSALAGVLVTAMVTPAIAVTSVTANNTVAIFDDLPEYIEIGQLTERNVLWATQGGQPVPFAETYDQNRQSVGWDQIAQPVKDAALAGEDERFYTHGGVDIAGIARAAVNNVTSGDTQGASTITQQLVKNLLINEALKISDPEQQKAAVREAQASSLERKLKEAKYAIGLEKNYSKQEILTGYLNIAGFGGNTYGIEAAAQLYFSTSAANLTVAQSAALLAIVQNPNSLRLDIPENRPATQARRDAILGNMLRLKTIDRAQYDEAIATPLDDSTIILKQPSQGCQYAAAARSFCDYVLRNVKNFASLGASEEERLANWKLGGYNVYTTIDLDQNAAAEATLAKYTPSTETRFQLGSAVTTLQVGTGQIRVMAQNKGYINTETDDTTVTSLNFNTDADYGGSTGFQVGSTYKLFTLINWLQNGHGLNETVNGSPATYRIRGECAGNAPYLFKNDANSNPGRVTVSRATALSVNAAFANMASKLDLCSIVDTAESMGVHRADGNPLTTVPTSILGVDEIAPMTMANAYATVANNGILCQPIAVDRIIAPGGAELPGQAADCAQAITPEVAAAAATALRGVMSSGGTGTRANPNDGTQLIGKTGTADALSTFLAASSTKLASAFWVGNIVGKQDLRKTSVGGINGGQLRFFIGKAILASLDASPYGADAGAFPTASRALQTGATQPVPNVIGQSFDQAKAVTDGLNLELTQGDTVASELPAGRIVSTDPAAGALVSKGTTITATISDGSLATTVPNVVGAQYADAVAALAAAGLDPAKITTEYVASANNQRCTVVSSNPAAGASISKAAAVGLTVNGGDNGPRTC